MITVLACYERISLFHTLEPFFRKRFRRLFRFITSPDFCLKQDKNDTLFMERWFQHRDPQDLTLKDFALMKKLRDKYKTIVFFNGQPEAGTNRLDLLPYVDRLFYKSVFTDKHNYQKGLYGKNLYADYYHRRYGVTDEREYRYSPVFSEKDLDRIELSWNIGVGSYPRRNWPQRAGVILARAGFLDLRVLFKADRNVPPPDFSGERRSIAVHARIDPVPCESSAYQRKLFINLVKNDSRFLSGMVSQNQYYRELRDSKMTLSPFGWGEVCFRDFEAIISGSLLLKPDMSHLVTWPDVYVPNETYVPLNWDGKDLMEKTAYYLENPRERERIARNAWERYQTRIAGLEDRFAALLGDLL
jgi:hypothetical protein